MAGKVSRELAAFEWQAARLRDEGMATAGRETRSPGTMLFPTQKPLFSGRENVDSSSQASILAFRLSLCP